MNHVWRRSERTAVLLFAFLSLVATAQGTELEKFTLGQSSVGPGGTGFWMAKEIGSFEKYGLQTDLVFISSGPVVVQALIGGDLHGGLAATNSVITAVLAGAPLVAVMSLQNRPYHRLWVHPEITRLEDLRGKTLGVTRFGSVTDNLTKILLRKNGLEGTVAVRQLGGTTEVSAAFKQRQIAGAVISILRVDAPMRMLVDLAEMDIRYSNVVVAVSRDFYRRSSAQIEAVVRAYSEGLAAIHNQKDRAFRVIAKHTRLTDRKFIDEIYNDATKSLDRVPRVEPEAIAPIVESMGKGPIAIETIADNSIVDRLVHEGFFEKLYKSSEAQGTYKHTKDVK
jgi:ABC-type nitrate/sulfonate/bicarbonate transport system substrate-binding protein